MILVSNEFLSILQLILLVITFAATVVISIMVYELYKISKLSKKDIPKLSKKEKGKEEIKKLPVVKEVRCPKCGTPMNLVYDGNVVDGYICPKCGYRDVKMKGERKKKPEAVETEKKETEAVK